MRTDREMLSADYADYTKILLMQVSFRVNLSNLRNLRMRILRTQVPAGKILQ